VSSTATWIEKITKYNHIWGLGYKKPPVSVRVSKTTGPMPVDFVQVII
jgi:hypothetical protein